MSEKDQEQFMKDTPLDGTPHFDMAAPAFVPKEEAEDLVVPEASGLSVTEMKAMKEEDLSRIKQYPIVEYLERKGIKPMRRTPAYALYRSPLREETHPSFKVDTEKNLWIDYAEGKGGSAGRRPEAPRKVACAAHRWRSPPAYPGGDWELEGARSECRGTTVEKVSRLATFRGAAGGRELDWILKNWL